MTDDFALLRDSFKRDLRLRNRAPRTVAAYVESIDRFADWARGQGLGSVTDVSRHHIRAWLETELDRVSAQTACRHYSATRQWFKWLTAEEEIDANPMDGIPQPAVPEKMTHVPSVDDIRALLKACSGKRFEDRRDAALILVLADGGPRAAEVCGLTVADVDLDAEVLFVTGKGRRPRGVPLGRKAAAAVDKYLRARTRHPLAGRYEALWLGARGPLGTSGLRQMLLRRGEEAGVPGMHPHALRHYFSDAWLRSGGSESSLMQVTGWKSRQMVDRYGAALAASRAREAHRQHSPGDRL